MYISKKNREIIRQKFNGLCAYSGTPLEDDWQVDHLISKSKALFMIDFGTGQKYPVNDFSNLMPTQKLINHYKRALDLETFRNEWLGKMHLRLAKLSKNPRTERGKKRKKYMLTIANYFGITENKPFSGKFYFEK